MKKIFILTAIIVLSVNVFAQFDESTNEAVSDELGSELNFTQLNNLGVKAITQKGDNELAIKFFEKALAENAACLECRVNLGRAKMRIGKDEEAVEILNEILRADPGSKEAYSSLGEAFSHLGKDKQGIAAYEKAIENGAYDDAITLTNYAISLNNQREYKKALKILDRALEIDSTLGETHTNRGTVLFNMGKVKQALESFKIAEKINPRNCTINNNLGVAYDTLGKDKLARKYYQAAVELDPTFGIAQYNLAASNLENGKREEAYKGLNLLKSLDNNLANDLQEMIWGKFVVNAGTRRIQ